MFKRLKTKLVVRKVADWFGPVPDSISHYINTQELIRAILAGLGTGTGLAGVLAALKASVGLWWLDPTGSALVLALITFAYDAYRRYKQGAKVSAQSIADLSDKGAK